MMFQFSVSQPWIQGIKFSHKFSKKLRLVSIAWWLQPQPWPQSNYSLLPVEFCFYSGIKIVINLVMPHNKKATCWFLMLELYTSMTPLSPLHVVQMTVDSPFLKQNISQDIRQQSTIRPTRYKRVIYLKWWKMNILLNPQNCSVFQSFLFLSHSPHSASQYKCLWEPYLPFLVWLGLVFCVPIRAEWTIINHLFLSRKRQIIQLGSLWVTQG